MGYGGIGRYRLIFWVPVLKLFVQDSTHRVGKIRGNEFLVFRGFFFFSVLGSA